jgi:hypothetical protein
MPCYINGQVVGNDRALCATNPMADWVEEQPPIGTSYPGPSLQDPQKLRPTLPTRNTQMSSLPPTSIFDRVTDTDDFGNPLDANFAGDTNFGLLRDQAVGTDNYDAYNSLGKYSKGNKVNLFEGIPGMGTISGTQPPAPAAGFGDIKSFKDFVYPSGKTTDARKAASQITAPFTRPFVEGSPQQNPVLIGEVKALMDKPVLTLSEYALGIKALSVLGRAGTPLAKKFFTKLNSGTKKYKLDKNGIPVEIGRNTKTVFNPKPTVYTALAAGAVNEGYEDLPDSVKDKLSQTYTTAADTVGTTTDFVTDYYKERRGFTGGDSSTGSQINNIISKSEKDSTAGGASITDKTKTDGTTTAPTTGVDKNIPTNKPAIDAGQAGLLASTKKPGFWSTPIEGGAGAWDNKLFRLGEMMAYMGTPLSKRGDSPAKRWTTAHSAAEKLKSDLLAASKKKDNIFGKIPTGTINDTIVTELKKKPWFLGLGQQFDEEELTSMGNKGEIVYMEWIGKGATPTQALKETLDELQKQQLGL